MTKKRGRKPMAKRERKDQLVQTRVPGDLSETLREAAKQKRVTVSQLIRNVLEDTFELVDNVVGDAVQLSQNVKRDAIRIAESAKGLGKRAASGKTLALGEVEAWQEVLLNRDVICAQCGRVVERGEKAAFAVVSDPTAAKLWLCATCAAALTP
ncbi:MAG TPA: hypothetical protein VGL86_09955 [Polyangia bacterium]|jgi:hypothetical protein